MRELTATHILLIPPLPINTEIFCGICANKFVRDHHIMSPRLDYGETPDYSLGKPPIAHTDQVTYLKRKVMYITVSVLWY